ncbi:MAG: MMPL family transporter [Pirellulales bacterium]|nr:MMPL family transporter [Pirellulales bacterium]
MFSRLADTIVQQRWIVIVLLVAVTLLALKLSRNLKFDFKVEALFYGEQEELAFNKQFNDTFTHEDNLVMVVLEATGDDDVLSAGAIKWQTELTTRLEKISNVERVVGLSTVRVPRVRALGRSRVMMVPVVRPDTELNKEELDRIRAKVADTPMLNGMLVSKDRQCAAVVAYFSDGVNEVSEVKEVVAAVEGELEKLPFPPGYELHVTGLPWIRLDISERLQSDQAVIVPTCAGLFLCILLLMYRRPSGLLIPWIAIGIGVLWTMATLAVLGKPLNIVTNVLPVLLMIVGVSNCVHVVSYFSEQSLVTPGDREGIARRTLRHMGSACLLTCMTTAIGFLSLLVADAEVLSGFGWQAAIGMGFIYIATMLVAGVLMPLLRAPDFGSSRAGKVAESVTRENSFLARVAAAMGGFATRRPYVVLAGAAWIMVGVVTLAQNVVIDSKLIETYDEDNPVVQTMHLVENKLGGFMPLELSLTADTEGKFQDADAFFRVAEATAYLRSLPEVTLVRSYVDLYREMDRALPGKPRFQGDAATEDAVEGSETTIRLQDAHTRLGDNKNSKTNRYRDYIAEDGIHARISVHVRDIGIRRAREVYDEIKKKLAVIFPQQSGIQVRLTGDSYYSSMAMRDLIGDLFYSLVGAAAVIFVVIAVLFHSLRLAIASVLPNTTPLIVTLGYMGLMAGLGFSGYAMSTGNVIVFAISLGIAVDDTIHFLARFRDEARQGGSADEIVRRTCLGTGRAIMLTSLLIVIGLSVVHLSQFVPTRRFAELTTVTMCAALLGDLLLLPACLKICWKSVGSTSRTPEAGLVRESHTTVPAAHRPAPHSRKVSGGKVSTRQ